jgi:hypothetical protein
MTEWELWAAVAALGVRRLKVQSAFGLAEMLRLLLLRWTPACLLGLDAA